MTSASQQRRIEAATCCHAARRGREDGRRGRCSIRRHLRLEIIAGVPVHILQVESD
jgi:hypothetical protein